MNAHGLTDTVAGVVGPAAPCPSCSGHARLVNGICVSCLLQEGLRQTPAEPGESLDTLLARVDVRDTDWRVGDYDILEEIGRGGMGVIYKARQRGSRRIVALKRVLSYHTDSAETLVRFRREAEAAASLDHPNILPIYEVGEADGLPFFTMKFAPGGSLQSAKEALLDNPRYAVWLLARVARAVHHAHSQGILHRDLKPGNILLDGWREPMVSDFGLAKWLDASSDLTRTLTIFGTPGYIASEQASGPSASLTPAADVYSLGAILFDLLAGRPPFLGEHALSVMRQAADRPAPNLRSLAPSLDRNLETICAKCLEREPEARYATAGAFAEDLEAWLEGRAITARPLGRVVGGWRWARRNNKFAASLAACIFLSAATLMWHLENRRLGVSVRSAQLAARSILVLPFIDLETGAADESVTQRVAQSLERTLSTRAPAQVHPLRDAQSWLAGTSAAADVTKAAANAGARFVVTGTRRNKDGKTRIALRLLSGASGELLLKRVFEDGLGNKISEAIASLSSDAEAVLLGKVDTSGNPSNDPGLRDPAAREFLVSGRQLVFRNTVADSDRATECFEQALRLQPASAIAHAYLANALGGRHHYAPDAAKLARAASVARIAVELAPESPDAHRALAGVLYQQGDIAAAEEAQLDAAEMGGTEERIAAFIGMTSVAQGEPVKALRWLQLAQHFATLPGDYDTFIGNCWLLLLEDERAEAAYGRAIKLRPENPDGWVGLIHLRVRQAHFDQARQLCREYRERFEAFPDPDSDAMELEATIEFFARSYMRAERSYRQIIDTRAARELDATHARLAIGRIAQARGEHDAAQRILLETRVQRPERMRQADTLATKRYEAAALAACLGESTIALDEFAAAAAAGWLDVRMVQLDPRFDAIRSDRRFDATLEETRSRIARLKQQIGPRTTNTENL